ncbi:MAG: hypothetical protein L6Q73_06805 [Aquabacterium sp.]|nr:hypothetical protein [Aquabacterium sp.]
MNRTIRLSAATAAALLATGLAQAQDPVRASFDRMLDHTACTCVAAVPAQASAAHDPLLAAMVQPLRDGMPAQAVNWARHDAAGASFERMLAHVASTHRPLVPQPALEDPLVLALVEPLRESLIAEARARRTQVAAAAR